MPPSRVREIFDRVVDLPGGERDGLLDRECAGDGALRESVVSLLAAHDGAGEFLAAPAISSDELRRGDDELPAGSRVGAYTIEKKLGEGGFADVYSAKQDPPLSRRVAIKVIKPGMDTRQVIARFELERSALAMMNHPNIATVLDAGSTDAGRPYFVMELVEGRPITEFCRSFELDLRARLGLFSAVCSAVQHAHERGVVHRDLKPSNVLVTLKDGNPVPKVIDFGIAKALLPQTAGDVLAAVTMYPQFLGTPQYMSPEQADASSSDGHVDSRSDVYSMGALLYELLADVPPYDPNALAAAGYANLAQVLRETDPAPPSARLTNASRKLRRRVRGDLDWITLKAMAKEPARRYASAEALASDIAHYLADEPVAAGPPGVRYRARKFVRRHRHALTMAAIAVAALIIGAFASRLNPARAARSPSSQPLAAAAPTPTSTPAAVQPGLSAEIFSGHFEKPVTRRVDRSIQFTWPRGVPPEQGVTVPRFAIKWTGAIVIPPGGVKAIGVEADDGARLYLDGNLLCEFHTPGRHFSANPVQAGTHTIEVDYWNRVAQGHVALLWVPSGKVAQVVPEQFLFQRAAK